MDAKPHVDVRGALLRLIFTAPGTVNAFPGRAEATAAYGKAWDEARAALRQTCPDHIVDGGGTCPNCHGDTADDPVTTRWTGDKQRRALADGWGIFDNTDHGLRIERNDSMARFDSDAAAQAYVAVRAIKGDALAVAAMTELAWLHAVLDAADQE